MLSMDPAAREVPHALLSRPSRSHGTLPLASAARPVAPPIVSPMAPVGAAAGAAAVDVPNVAAVATTNRLARAGRAEAHTASAHGHV